MLDAITEINSDVESTETFLGTLLWLCPKCVETPKNIEVSKNSCKPSTTPNGNSNDATTRSKPICKKYRYGKCSDDKCNFSHPAKCLQYCRYGRDGCNGGFSSCKLLHPVICRDSLNNSKCFDPNCTLSHLKGTIRNREAQYGNFHSEQTRKMSKYSPFDPKNLGFQRYHQTRRYNNNAHDFNQAKQPPISDNYVYNPNEYPTIHSQQSSQKPYNHRGHDSNEPLDKNDFLELMKQIQSMQHTQRIFQQELMTLKGLSPPPQQSLNQGFYSQPQPPLQFLPPSQEVQPQAMV